MKEKSEFRMERRVTWKGITRCAAELKVSRIHLHDIMVGKRKPGEDLERRMRKIGLVPGSAA